MRDCLNQKVEADMNFHDKRITQLEQGIDKIAETMANLVLMTEAVAD